MAPSQISASTVENQAKLNFCENGRSERIRTSDPLYPKQVRYQAAPRSDRGAVLDGVKAIEKPKPRIQHGQAAVS